MIEDITLFSETQRFKQIWIWIILISVNILVFTGVVQQVFLGQQFGDHPASNTTLLIGAAILVCITALFCFIHLDTIISTNGISVRFFPLQKRFSFYSWDRISKIFIRSYNATGEYGGWGFRGFGFNRALNISGNVGIQISLVNGDQLLIGTNKPEQVNEVLKQIGQIYKMEFKTE